MTGITTLLKRIPLDLGQGKLRTTTKGKLIAMDYVLPGHGKRALDIVCREGDQSKWLESKGCPVTSVDIEKVYDKAEIVDANEPLPFADASFDLVWCSKVIEHLAGPKIFLREVDRVQIAGGRLALTTPNSSFWLYPMLRIFGLRPADVQHPGHRHFFSFTDMRELFPDVGIEGFFPYQILRCKISRCVGLLSPTFVVCKDKRRTD